MTSGDSNVRKSKTLLKRARTQHHFHSINILLFNEECYGQQRFTDESAHQNNLHGTFGYIRGKVKDGPDGFPLDDTKRLGLLKELMAPMDPELKIPLRYPRPSESVTVSGDRSKWNKPAHPALVTLCCARGAEQFSQLNTALSQGIQEGRVSEPSKWRLVTSVGPATSSTLIRSILLDDQTIARNKSGTNWQNTLCSLMYWTRAILLTPYLC